MRILDVELAFDITSPTDVRRYNEAGKKMEARAGDIPGLPDSPEQEKDESDNAFNERELAYDRAFLDAWMEMLNAELRLFGNFIDEVFGDGVAEKLLGNNPSLSKVIEINDELALAMEDQGRAFGVKLQKYSPDKQRRGDGK